MTEISPQPCGVLDRDRRFVCTLPADHDQDCHQQTGPDGKPLMVWQDDEYDADVA